MYSEFLHSQHDRVFGEQYDKCIVGYDLNTGQIVYSVSKIVKVLQKDEYMEYLRQRLTKAYINFALSS